MTSQQIRQQFIDFFVQRHGHTFVPSSPVVPVGDDSLLFTNAGMNQFKPIFLGQEKREYTRVANTQKCIRAGGKHNDLDDVGRSRRHHTFFEMLGNWSFGDYFKRGAIEMAWELLTKVWQLDASRLHVSCYEGNESAGIPRDTEAADLWKQIAGLPDDHIHYFGKDNFWEMGETGPCGPCTEIYIDRTPGKTGGKDVNGEDPRVMEIWNLVFIQYNRTWKPGGEDAVRAFDKTRGQPLPNEDAGAVRDRTRLHTFGTSDRSEWVNKNTSLDVLPSQHVDTGMGFERITQVLQGKDDNYATDLWTPLFDAIAVIAQLNYAGLFPKTNATDPVAEAANVQLRHDIAFRVVADHARCLTFALTDGAVPSNEGRGYVLRRILRRAVRFGRQHLGLQDPFLYRLVPIIVESMSSAFPELRKNPEHVADVIKDEEVGFGRTLDRGITLFEIAAADTIGRAYAQRLGPSVIYAGNKPVAFWKGDQGSESRALEDSVKELNFVRSNGEVVRTVSTSSAYNELKLLGVKLEISAETAFKLYDTYGFPLDLTRIMAEERGLSVDIPGYEKLMDEAKDRARSGGKEGESHIAQLSPDALAQLSAANVKPTNDAAKYAAAPISANVMAIWNGDDLGVSPASVMEDEELAVILDSTNFYAEMGGQVGDVGELRGGDAIFDVQSTRIVGGFILHIGRLRAGKLRVRDKITAIVAPSRDLTRKNHTTTHLANWALREVLGDGVQQKGSLVDPEKLRFDFSHGKALSDEELARVETLVNREIEKRLPVYAEEAPQEQALKINGLRAVFGEKYPPRVRVVSIGAPVAELLADPDNAKWRHYSIEFCGGTHLNNAGDATTFTVIAEESVSKGIRRLVALTGRSASAARSAAERIDATIEQSKTAPDAELPKFIALLNEALSGSIPLRAKRRAQAAVAELQARYKAFEKKSKATSGGSGDAVAVAAKLLESAATFAGGKVVVGEIPGANDEQLRSAMDSLKKKTGSYGILLGAADDGKVNFVASVSDDLIARGLKAGDWVREAAKAAGGGGGGRPQMAQAGGKDPAKLPEALQIARKFAETKLG